MKKRKLLNSICLATAMSLALSLFPAELHAESSAQNQICVKEQKSISGNERQNTIYSEGDIVYEDKNVIIKFDGIYGEEDEYDINFIVQNISARSIVIQVRETSINGFMVDPTCSMEIAPGKKIKDGMRIDFDDARTTPKSDVKEIETKFHIFDWGDDDFGYDTEFINMINTHTHSYNLKEVIERATCTENGKIKYICSCGNYYTEIISKTGHKYSNWITTKKPTIFKNGTQTRKCSTCGKQEIKTIKKLKSSVSIKKKVSIKAGKTMQLKITRKSKGDKMSSWKSSKKSVATVSKKGKVTAKKKGKAKITVKMKSGCKATCTVTVK